MTLRFHKNAIIFLALLVAGGGAYIGSLGFVDPVQQPPVEIASAAPGNSMSPVDNNTDTSDFSGLLQKRLQGPPPLPVQTVAKNDVAVEETAAINNTPPPPVTVTNIDRSPNYVAVTLRNIEGIKKSGFEGDSVFEWKIKRIDNEGDRVLLEYRGNEYWYSLQ